jgi:hypothetical protein
MYLWWQGGAGEGRGGRGGEGYPASCFQLQQRLSRLFIEFPTGLQDFNNFDTYQHASSITVGSPTSQRQQPPFLCNSPLSGTGNNHLRYGCPLLHYICTHIRTCIIQPHLLITRLDTGGKLCTTIRLTLLTCFNCSWHLSQRHKIYLHSHLHTRHRALPACGSSQRQVSYLQQYGQHFVLLIYMKSTKVYPIFALPPPVVGSVREEAEGRGRGKWRGGRGDGRLGQNV